MNRYQRFVADFARNAKTPAQARTALRAAARAWRKVRRNPGGVAGNPETDELVRIRATGQLARVLGTSEKRRGGLFGLGGAPLLRLDVGEGKVALVPQSAVRSLNPSRRRRNPGLAEAPEAAAELVGGTAEVAAKAIGGVAEVAAEVVGDVAETAARAIGGVAEAVAEPIGDVLGGEQRNPTVVARPPLNLNPGGAPMARRRNPKIHGVWPEFWTDANGVVHPIRRSAAYREWAAGERLTDRQREALAAQRLRNPSRRSVRCPRCRNPLAVPSGAIGGQCGGCGAGLAFY